MKKKIFLNENYPQDLKSSSCGGIGTWLKHMNVRTIRWRSLAQWPPQVTCFGEESETWRMVPEPLSPYPRLLCIYFSFQRKSLGLHFSYSELWTKNGELIKACFYTPTLPALSS